MGHATAAGYAEMVEEGLDLSTAIRAHMASNLYPAPPAYMVPVAVAAVEAARGDYEDGGGELIDLPDGVGWIHGDRPTAAEVIQSFRLDAFV